VGRATAGTEIAILDDAGQRVPARSAGEVVVRGSMVMSGYENDPVANAAAFRDGWFRTGDLGYLDDDGYLFLTGGVKELINRGGGKVAPQEVEQVLLAHPSVAQAAVFAVPHARLGEDVAAAVVLRAGASMTEPAVRAFVGGRLASFKVPRRVLFLDALPI